MKKQEEIIRELFISQMHEKIKKAHRLGDVNRDFMDYFTERNWQCCPLCRECLEGQMGVIPLTFKKIKALQMFREEYRIARDFIETGGPAVHFLRSAVVWKKYLFSIAPEAMGAGNRYLLGSVAR